MRIVALTLSQSDCFDLRYAEGAVLLNEESDKLYLFCDRINDDATMFCISKAQYAVAQLEWPEAEPCFCGRGVGGVRHLVTWTVIPYLKYPRAYRELDRYL